MVAPSPTMASTPLGSSGADNFLAWALVVMAVKAFLWSLLTTSLVPEATSTADVIGHSSTALDRNAGPLCHRESPSS